MDSSPKTRWALYGAVGTLVIGSFFVGREIGHYNSPDYSKESSAFRFLTAHMRVVSSDNNDVKLAVSAGNHIYEYTLSSNSATRVGKPAFEIANVPIKKRWALLEDKRIMDFAGIAVSVPAATGALSKISAATERLTAGPRLGLYIAGAAILATGGIVGYLTTYNDAADYDNETFQKTLLDSANWHETARLIKACGIIKRAFEIISEIELSNHDDGEKPAASLRDSARSAELRRTCSNIQAWLADHL